MGRIRRFRRYAIAISGVIILHLAIVVYLLVSVISAPFARNRASPA